MGLDYQSKLTFFQLCWILSVCSSSALYVEMGESELGPVGSRLCEDQLGVLLSWLRMDAASLELITLATLNVAASF